jgi:hypothetical protein
VGRWGVWVFTAWVLISIPVSVWVEPEVFVWHEEGPPSHRLKPWSLHLIDGRIVWYSEIGLSAHIVFVFGSSEYPKFVSDPGWRARVDFGVSGFGMWTSGGSWWVPRFYDDRPFAYRFDLPLIYPAVLMLGWSGLLYWNPGRRRRLVAGCCVGCGYSLAGLDGGVCPECGAGADVAS